MYFLSVIRECLNDSLITLRKYNSIDQKIDRVSKKERNIYFYILGSLLLIEPLMKVLFLQLKTDFPIETVMGVVLSIEEPLKALEFWALFPLAGFALIRASGGSLFVFAGVHIYSAYALLTYKQFSWPFVQESPHVSSILLVALNLTLLIYFLIPENRRPFVNKTKDMFRKYKRLNIDGEGTLIFGENKMDVLIKDISLGGISFSASKDIKEFINLTIQIEDMSLSIEIKRTLQDGQKYIHGCRFNKLSFAEKKKLKKYLRKLDRNIEYYEHKAA